MQFVSIVCLMLGAVDILVNCAGTSIAAEFDQLTGQDFSHMYQTNVLGKSSIQVTRVCDDVNCVFY